MNVRAGLRRAVRLAVCLLWVGAPCASALAVTTLAHAQPASASRPSAPLRVPAADVDVEVLCAGSDADISALEPVLRELLASTRIALRRSAGGSADTVLQRTPSARPRAPVRVWIDLRGPRVAVVVLVDERAERVVVRNVPLASAARADEVIREEIAHIVSTSARAILAGVPVGVSREVARRELGLTAPPNAPPLNADSAAQQVSDDGAAQQLNAQQPNDGARTDVAAQQPDDGARTDGVSPPTDSDNAARRRASPSIVPSLRVTLGYEARLWSSDVLTHGAALSLDAGAALGRLRLGARLESVPRLRVRYVGESLGVVLDPIGARLLATCEWRATERLSVDIALGAALEIVHLRATRTAGTEPDVVLAAPRTRVDGLASVGLGAAFALAARFSVGARVMLDVDPAAARYVWLRDGEPVVVYAPAPLRPALTIYVRGELL